MFNFLKIQSQRIDSFIMKRQVLIDPYIDWGGGGHWGGGPGLQVLQVGDVFIFR